MRLEISSRYQRQWSWFLFSPLHPFSQHFPSTETPWLSHFFFGMLYILMEWIVGMSVQRKAMHRNSHVQLVILSAKRMKARNWKQTDGWDKAITYWCCCHIPRSLEGSAEPRYVFWSPERDPKRWLELDTGGLGQSRWQGCRWSSCSCRYGQLLVSGGSVS